ncbi:MAG: DUF4956 domain-containing protein [Tissierellia bacterium]|nr:DUF4956 domain-containing protein [Tissierellia bacterium]
MTFKDVFKSSFLENVNSIPIFDMVFVLLLSFMVGMFIFWVYKKTYRGVMYSSGFGAALISLTMITTFVILAVTSNVVLSLGMVGALSLVRFRTAIKEPIEIAFLFWSIAVGIVLAAGLIPLAVIGSGLIGIVMLVFVNWNSYDDPYILMIICENQDIEKTVNDTLNTSVKKMILKSKSVAANQIELNYEVRLLDDNSEFINEIAGIEGVINTILVSYNGDYVG